MKDDISPKCVMIIAGEASGDLHGSHLVRAIRDKHMNVFFYGIGGPLLKAAGVRVFIDASELAVVGITEALANARRLLKGMRTAKRVLRILHPDLLILIDFPDFNLQVAREAKKLGIPVLYYIGPQIWAWRQGRVNKIKKLVDHMAAILPFEKPFFEKAHVPATFVGHPLLDTDRFGDIRFSEHTIHDAPIIGLLPGSRAGEIHRHLPVMLETAQVLSKQIKKVVFILSVAPMVDKRAVENILQKKRKDIEIVIETGDVKHIFAKSHVVVTASGTVTLEAAIAGIPSVVIYRLSFMSYWLAKALIQVDFICLVNLIAGKCVYPELIQSEASPKQIAEKVVEIISDSGKRDQIRQDLLAVREALGGPGASQRVADIALNMFNSSENQ